jgi:hypothetical protein
MRTEDFVESLHQWSTELFADNPSKMAGGSLLATKNVIDETDVELFGRGVEAGLVTVFRGGRFNTLDRPVANGRWSLLSRSRQGGWYNAEYLPQIAAYVSAILDHSFDQGRVMFELPASALQLDLAILADDGSVLVLGEAKRDTTMLSKLVSGMEGRFADSEPSVDSQKRGDETRQLAWRLWTTRAPYLWLIAPGERRAFSCSYGPLRLRALSGLPDAMQLGVAHAPPAPVVPAFGP